MIHTVNYKEQYDQCLEYIENIYKQLIYGLSWGFIVTDEQDLEENIERFQSRMASLQQMLQTCQEYNTIDEYRQKLQSTILEIEHRVNAMRSPNPDVDILYDISISMIKMVKDKYRIILSQIQSKEFLDQIYNHIFAVLRCMKDNRVYR